MATSYGKVKRVFRSRAQEKAISAGKKVESANSLEAKDFFHEFCPSEAIDLTTLTSEHGSSLQVILENAEGISDNVMVACLGLIEETSASNYKNSEIKWSSTKKRKEMRLPDMKYIVFLEQNATDRDPNLIGFVSFMITYEDDHEVVYIYEIHFTHRWRSKGLGKKLMSAVEQIGLNVGVEKAMLTVFKANNNAILWYQRLGYTEDEYSPGPRQLRNGTVIEPSYIILSKKLGLSDS